MGLIKEARNVDLSTKSEPWTEQELIDFRKIIEDRKTKSETQKQLKTKLKRSKKQIA